MNERQQQKPNDQCLDMGLLVSLRDDELTVDEKAKVTAHLAVCPDCAADERGVASGSREVYDLLATLDPLPNEIPNPTTALVAMQTRLNAELPIQLTRREAAATRVALSAGILRSNSEDRPETVHVLTQNRTGLFQGNRLRKRYGWLTAAVAAVLVALLLLPNASVLADQFLALFRVQQFQPVTIDPQDFSYSIISNLQNFSDMQVRFDKSPADPTEAQVKQLIHFPLLLPSHLPSGVGHVMHFNILQSGHGVFTFDATKARAYLAQTGQSAVRIPAQLDGATFTITTDPGVVIDYSNNCQQVKSASAEKTTSSQDEKSTSARCLGGAPFYIGEIPSPVVQSTGKATIKDLRDFLLSLPKLSPQMRIMLQHLDLEKGIVPLPIPAEVHAQQVTVHGAPGVLLADTSLKAGAVIWQTRGIIYMVATIATGGTEILDTANSLR